MLHVRLERNSFSCYARSSIIVWSCAGGWPQDPRLKELGQRAILPKGTDTGSNDQSEDPAAAYRRLRHTLGIAEGPSEIPQGKKAFLSAGLSLSAAAKATVFAGSTSLLPAAEMTLG